MRRPTANSDPVERWKQLAREHMSNARVPGERGAVPPRIRITYGFAVVTLAIGLRFGVAGPIFTFVLLSTVLLAQELPRALIAYGLKRSAEVRLSVLGGRTHVYGPELRGVAAFAITTAGSAVNLVTAASCLAIWRTGLTREASALLELWIWSHAAWGIGQAIPLLPFRAGCAICERWSAPDRLMYAVLSAGILFAIALLSATRAWPPALFPVMVLSAVAALAEASRAFGETSDVQTLVPELAARAAQRLREGDSAGAALDAERGLAVARSVRARDALNTTLAWAAITQRNSLLARDTIAKLPRPAVDHYLVAAYLRCSGREEEAIELLREARDRGCRDAESRRLLIDLLYCRGQTDTALAVASADSALLSVEDIRLIESMSRTERAESSVE